MDNRKDDLEFLRKSYKETNNPGLKRIIRESALKIGKETKAIRDMRERLVKEHRKNNVENIKDIHEYIKNKEKYQNR